MRHWLARIAGRRDGAAAVEMALLVPLMAGVMFVSLDLAGAAHMRLQLQAPANRSVEMAIASQSVASDLTPVLTEARTAYGKPLTAASLSTWLECDGVTQANLTEPCIGQERARYLSVSLQAEYVPSFGLGGLLRGPAPRGGYYMRGHAVVRLQ